MSSRLFNIVSPTEADTEWQSDTEWVLCTVGLDIAAVVDEILQAGL